MPALIIALVSGLIFGTGIALSGMGNPAKVLNFFDFAGSWDPSLAFVMGGALIVTAIGYRFVLKLPHPLFDAKFHLPTRKDIDKPLIAGSVIFGIGWGIAGFCPGGSIPAIGLFESDAVIFVASMVFGIAIARLVRPMFQQTDSGQQAGAAQPRDSIRKLHIRKIGDRFSISSQVKPEQIAALAAEGYKLIVCNRPDGEERGQPSFAEIAAAAKQANINAVYIPMAGPPTGQQIAALKRAMAEAGGPALAYCRSGGRSQKIYAAAKS